LGVQGLIIVQGSKVQAAAIAEGNVQGFNLRFARSIEKGIL
jgi:hypothetical protein